MRQIKSGSGLGTFGRTLRTTVGPPGSPCLVGIPSDILSVTGSGAKGGPAAIRFVSQELPHSYFKRTDMGMLFDYCSHASVQRPVNLADLGDLTVSISSSPRTIGRDISAVVLGLCANQNFPIVMGGDHSITYSAVKGIANPKLALICFDAHLDNARPSEGTLVDNASVIGELMSRGHVTNVFSLGVRGILPAIKSSFRKIHNVLSTVDIRERGLGGVLTSFPSNLEYWISLDLDVFDPSIAPGTNTPVPGGLCYDEVSGLLIEIMRHRKVVGFDLVELVPDKDINLHTARLAAHIIFSVAAYCSQTGGRVPTKRA